MLEAEAKRLTVKELKEELKRRSLPLSGLKAELQARLLGAIQADDSGATANGDAEDGPAAVPSREAEPKQVSAVEPAAAAGAAPLEEVPEVPAVSEAAGEVPEVPAASEAAEPASVAPPEAHPEQAKPRAAAAAPVVAELAAEAVAPAPVDGDAGEEPAPATVAAAAPAAAAGTEDAVMEDAPPAAAGAAAEPGPEASSADVLEAIGGDNAGEHRADESRAGKEAGVKPSPVEAVGEKAAEKRSSVASRKRGREDEPRRPAPREQSSRDSRGETERRASPLRDTKRGRKELRSEPSDRRKRSPIPAFKPRDLPPPVRTEKRAEPRAEKRGEGGEQADAPRPDLASRLSGLPRASAGARAERGPPPSAGAATRALRIDGFVRPFREEHCRQMLAQYGTLAHFWMPNVKNLAYVVYEDEDAAAKAKDAVSGVAWPPDNQVSLRPRFVSVEEAESNGEVATPRSHPRVGPLGSGQQEAPAAAAPPEKSAQPEEPQILDARSIIDRRKASAAAATAAALPPGAADGPRPRLSQRGLSERLERGLPQAAAAGAARGLPQAVPEPELEKTVDDWFRRTRHKPYLYWLPLTEEQVKAKLAAEAEAVEKGLPGPPPPPL